MNLDALPKGVYEEWQDLLSRPDDQVVRVTVLTYSEDASEDMRQMEQRLIPLEDRAALDPSFGTYGAHPTLTNGSFTIRSRDSQNLQVIILLGFLLSGLVTIMLHSITIVTFACIFSRRVGNFLFDCAIYLMERLHEVDTWVQLQGIDHPWKHVYDEQRAAWSDHWPEEEEEEDEEDEEAEEGKKRSKKGKSPPRLPPRVQTAPRKRRSRRRVVELAPPPPAMTTPRGRGGRGRPVTTAAAPGAATVVAAGHATKAALPVRAIPRRGAAAARSSVGGRGRGRRGGRGVGAGGLLRRGAAS